MFSSAHGVEDPIITSQQWTSNGNRKQKEKSMWIVTFVEMYIQISVCLGITESPYICVWFQSIDSDICVHVVRDCLPIKT